MIETQQTYVLIKIAGRSWSAVYHELARDGSTPLCGTPIKADDWALRTREQAWRRRQCRQCARLVEAAAAPCKHEQLVEGYYGHDCATCGELVYPCGSAPWDDCGDDDSNYPAAGCDEYDDDDEDEWLYRCGWVRGEGCTKAGSEECDWECPMRRDFEKGLRLTQARLAKRGKL